MAIGSSNIWPLASDSVLMLLWTTSSCSEVLTCHFHPPHVKQGLLGRRWVVLPTSESATVCLYGGILVTGERISIGAGLSLLSYLPWVQRAFLVEATSEPVAGWIGQKATQFCMRNFLDRPSGRLQVRPSEDSHDDGFCRWTHCLYMNAMKAAKKGAQGDDENRHDRIHQFQTTEYLLPAEALSLFIQNNM